MPFTLPLGAQAPDFNLIGIDDKVYSLASFKDAKLLVIVFSCNHCPFVVGSERRMIQFHGDYAPRRVALVAINSNETVNHPKDSFPHMKLHAREKGFKFPYLRDDSQQVAFAYGALRTPHFYVFDSQRNLCYTGRMDDNPRTPGMEKTHELRDAIDALLAGRQPAISLTNPIGCNVKWKNQDPHWMPPEACDLVPASA